MSDENNKDGYASFNAHVYNNQYKDFSIESQKEGDRTTQEDVNDLAENGSIDNMKANKEISFDNGNKTKEAKIKNKPIFSKKYIGDYKQEEFKQFSSEEKKEYTKSLCSILGYTKENGKSFDDLYKDMQKIKNGDQSLGYKLRDSGFNKEQRTRIYSCIELHNKEKKNKLFSVNKEKKEDIQNNETKTENSKENSQKSQEAQQTKENQDLEKAKEDAKQALEEAKKRTEVNIGNPLSSVHSREHKQDEATQTNIANAEIKIDSINSNNEKIIDKDAKSVSDSKKLEEMRKLINITENNNEQKEKYINDKTRKANGSSDRAILNDIKRFKSEMLNSTNGKTANVVAEEFMTESINKTTSLEIKTKKSNYELNNYTQSKQAQKSQQNQTQRTPQRATEMSGGF